MNTNLIPFDQAYQIVLDNSKDFGIENIALSKSTGRILRESWYTDRPLPPYDRVTMDGIAINFDGLRSTENIKIEGIAAAGDPQKTLRNFKSCFEVMTGSILPNNCDTVIRYEDLTLDKDLVTINSDYRKAQNVHGKGEDNGIGDLLCESGLKINSAVIGVGATIGKSLVAVSQLPRAIVISTGNELVNIDQEPLTHQIRKSNVHRITALLSESGIIADTLHLDDDLDEITSKLKSIISDYDLVILSGGVSKGKFDFIPDALENLGVEKLFHKVAQRPGKPFWFGKKENAATVFAMPGNPVSSYMCTQVYLKSWLSKSLGENQKPQPRAILAQDISFKPDLTRFVVVSVYTNEQGNLVADPSLGNGSGNLSNLLNGNAFIMLNAGKDLYEKGSVQDVFYF